VFLALCLGKSVAFHFDPCGQISGPFLLILLLRPPASRSFYCVCRFCLGRFFRTPAPGPFDRTTSFVFAFFEGCPPCSAVSVTPEILPFRLGDAR